MFANTRLNDSLPTLPLLLGTGIQGHKVAVLVLLMHMVLHTTKDELRIVQICCLEDLRLCLQVIYFQLVIIRRSKHHLLTVIRVFLFESVR